MYCREKDIKRENYRGYNVGENDIVSPLNQVIVFVEFSFFTPPPPPILSPFVAVCRKKLGKGGLTRISFFSGISTLKYRNKKFYDQIRQKLAYDPKKGVRSHRAHCLKERKKVTQPWGPKIGLFHRFLIGILKYIYNATRRVREGFLGVPTNH